MRAIRRVLIPARAFHSPPGRTPGESEEALNRPLSSRCHGYHLRTRVGGINTRQSGGCISKIKGFDRISEPRLRPEPETGWRPYPITMLSCCTVEMRSDTFTKPTEGMRRAMYMVSKESLGVRWFQAAS